MKQQLVLSLFLLFLGGCFETDRQTANMENVWNDWVPSEMVEGPIFARDFFEYLRATLQKTCQGKKLKVYVDSELFSEDSAWCSRINLSRSDDKLVNQKDIPPQIPKLDHPPKIDLRTALKLYCDALGAKFRREGDSVYIDKK